MRRLRLTLFGPFTAHADGGPITAFRTDKARALLAYLALNPDRPHARRALAGLLWADKPERTALDNVRVTFYRLRQAIRAVDSQLEAQLFTATRQTILLHSAASDVDALRFQALLHSATGQQPMRTDTSSADIALLEEATALYQGELLTGFSLPDAAAFEEWLLLQREALHHQAVHSLHTLTQALHTRGDLARATQYALRLIDLDSLSEAHHRIYMQLLAQSDQGVQALAHYKKLRHLLNQELGVEPDVASAALYAQIRDAAPPVDQASPPPTLPPLASPPHAPPAVPAPVYGEAAKPPVGALVGREQELTQLRQWAESEQCRMIEILGMGGVGKSTLAAAVAAHYGADLHEESASDAAPSAGFDAVIWRSLLNAPALGELLASILRRLGLWNSAAEPASPAQQLAVLLAEMQRRRILLVLDNLESITQDAQAGHLRADYADYAEFFQRMATGAPGSCLMVTSRERLAHMGRWQEEGALHAIVLHGLSSDAGQTLLQGQGIKLDVAGAAALVQRCSGNPLALKLVASTIQELFAGDIDDFFAGDTVIFDDIRTVLDNQFARLTPLEEAVLFWLAAAREPINAAALRAAMLPVPEADAFLEALQNLQRRSLLERYPSGFTLQNVVLEYMTERIVELAVAELHAVDLKWLHTHALVQAQAGDAVRLSQVRRILAPVALRLRQRVGRHALSQTLWRVLDNLHTYAHHLPSYAAGNLLNLLLYVGADLTGSDFSRLCVRQADLRLATLEQVDFRDADLSASAFATALGRILTAAVSPDGRTLATGGDQGQLRIWSLPESHQIDQLTQRIGAITAVVFSPDGLQVAAASRSATIMVWSWREGQRAARLLGHVGSVFGLAYHPTGTLLASGGQDQTVRLWSMPAGLLLDTQQEHASAILAVAFHPAGDLLATGDADGTLCLWKVVTQSVGSALRLVRTLPAHEQELLALTFSPDGTRLASASADTTIRLWAVATGAAQGELRGHAHWVRALIFRSDGRVLFSAGADQTVRAWDVESRLTLAVLRGHTHVIRALALTPDDQILVSGGLDDAVRLWNITRLHDDPAIRTLQGYMANVRTLKFDPTGRWLATGDGKGNVRTWQVEQDSVQPASHRILPGRGRQVNGLDFSPDGRFVAAADDDACIRIWSVATGELSDVLHGHRAAAHAVKYLPDGQMAVTCSYDGAIYVWDLSVPGGGRIAHVLAGHAREAKDLCVTPDGRTLISIGTDHALRLWDLATGQCKQVLANACRDGKCLSLQPGGSLLAAAGSTEQIALFSLEDGAIQPLDVLFSGGLMVTQVAFSPDGTQLASAGEGGAIRLWDMAQREEVQTLHAHALAALGFAFSPSGRLLASGGMDEVIRVWQIGSEAQVSKLRLPGPYAEMNIGGATGITAAQRRALKTLGAVENDL